MSTLSQFYGGGAVSKTTLQLQEPIALQVSQTITPTFTFEALVYVIGGGGSGGLYSSPNFSLARATGGGAGGTAISRLTLSSGVTYTATVGAGAAAYGPTTQGNGSTGGTSSFSGSGITTMTANGGNGGTYSATLGASVAAGNGGNASGGNIGNVTGGKGQSTTVPNSGDFASGTHGGFVKVAVALGTDESIEYYENTTEVYTGRKALTGLVRGIKSLDSYYPAIANTMTGYTPAFSGGPPHDVNAGGNGLPVFGGGGGGAYENSSTNSRTNTTQLGGGDGGIIIIPLGV